MSVLQSGKLTNVPASNLVNTWPGKSLVSRSPMGRGRIFIPNSHPGSEFAQRTTLLSSTLPISNELLPVNSSTTALCEADYGMELVKSVPTTSSPLPSSKDQVLPHCMERAANGVVLVSTKGRGSRGLGITTNSMVTLRHPLPFGLSKQVVVSTENMPSMTDKVAVSTMVASVVWSTARSRSTDSQFDSPSVDADGNPVRAGDVIALYGTYTPITPTPWVSRPNNVRNFLETGMTFHNNIAFNLSGEKGSTRISYTNLRNSGIMPNTNLKRDGLAISLDQDVDDRLNISAFLNYVNSRSDNRPNLGYGYENPMYGFIWTGRQTNIQSLRDYWQAGQEGLERFDFNYLWVNNPYLTLYENTNGFNKNRVLGNVAADYQFSGKWMLTVRTGLDAYHDLRTFRRAVSTNANPFGSYREDQVKFHELNLNARISYQSDLGETWRYTLVGGMNRFDQRTRYQYSQASQLAIPGIYT